MTRRNTATGLTPDQAVGMTVNQVMFTQGVTRAELSRRIGVSSSSVSMKLRGQVGWSLEDIFETAAALGLDVSAILPTRAADGGWVPAPYVPGAAAAAPRTTGAPAPSGAGAPGTVAGAGFEPATSGLRPRAAALVHTVVVAAQYAQILCYHRISAHFRPSPAADGRRPWRDGERLTSPSYSLPLPLMLSLPLLTAVTAAQATPAAMP